MTLIHAFKYCYSHRKKWGWTWWRYIFTCRHNMKVTERFIKENHITQKEYNELV